MAATEELVGKLKEFAEKQDFGGAFALVREHQAELDKGLTGEGIRDELKKTTKDRLLLSFLDAAGFGEKPLDKSLFIVEKLRGFTPGTLVLNETWGVGKVKRADDFYRKITVDFKMKRGHQFTYAAAVDLLERAPEDHILVLREADRAAYDALFEKKGEFIKAVLKSYGDMPATKLESVCVSTGMVKAANWKKYWDAARAELRADKLVEIPAKRADPIRLRASAENYGDSWLTAFSHETDPKLILASAREFVEEGRFKTASDAEKAVVGERLAFAVTASRNVDDALYARLACMLTKLGFEKPPAAEMRDYLWDRRRFVKAAADLPSREVGDMIRFIATDADAKERVYKALPALCFTAVTEIVSQFGDDPACRRAVGDLLRSEAAPATLVTLVVGKYEKFAGWEELPPLVTILSHAVALGEGRQNGEILRMQDIVRRLFGDEKWLSKMFAALNPADQVLFFERFQASIAWDPSTHHTTVVRMTHIVPELASHVVKVEKKKDYARVTSFRAYATKKAEYLKLINEDMPENVRKIEFAKGFGDLSENAEYQYAKDEQRQLMQKQSLMQADLEAVKAGDFSDATTDEVMPGVTVVISTPEGEKTYHVLGEWDNDIEKGIISSKTRLAQNMLGKKVGDQFELPGAEGTVKLATVKEIRALSEDVREWMKLPPGMQI